MQTTLYLINRTPLSVLKDKSPHELLFEEKPGMTYLKAFGCLVFATKLKQGRHMFAPRAEPCVFFGISIWSKGL